jgi:hypothetical protein
MLRAGSHSFDQLDASSHRVVASYYYKDITAIYEASDYPGGFVLQVCLFVEFILPLFDQL